MSDYYAAHVEYLFLMNATLESLDVSITGTPNMGRLEEEALKTGG